MCFRLAQTLAQDLHYSQHVYNPMYYNPAFTGFIPEKARLIANYADRYRQSLSSEGLSTVFGSADMNIDLSGKYAQTSNRFLGIGAYFYNHKRGDRAVVDNTAAVNVSYRMLLDRERKHSISAGFQFLYWNRNYNLRELQFGNQFDGIMYNPGINSGESTNLPAMNRLDAGMGVVYAYDSRSLFKGYIGASAFHLIPEAIRRGETNLPFRFNVHGGMELRWDELSVLPSLMIDYQKDAMEIYLGSMVRYAVVDKKDHPVHVIGGPFLRAYRNPSGDLSLYTFNLLAGVQLNEFQILVAFDNTINSSSVVFGGFNGFELSLSYNLGQAVSSRGHKLYCPAFR